MSANVTVIARSPDWEISRHNTTGTYWVRWRHDNQPPPTSIPVQGVDYPLSGRRNRVPVAVAAMLTAWTGARKTGPPTTVHFSRYLRAHRDRAAEAGVHPHFPTPQ